MADFAPTTPAMRLFDEIDLAPAPQTATLQRALNTWREERGEEIVPSVTALQSHVASALAGNIFMFEPVPDGDGFSLSTAGKDAAEVFGSATSGGTLSEFANRRVAVYTRHLFDMAKQRREAVCVRFTLRPRGKTSIPYEMLAAPVGQGDGAHGRGVPSPHRSTRRSGDDVARGGVTGPKAFRRVRPRSPRPRRG